MPIITIAMSSDEHVGHKRRAEKRESLHWLADVISDCQCDAHVSGGDWFDKTAAEEDILITAEFLNRVDCRQVYLKGNHGTEKGLQVLEQITNRGGYNPYVARKPEIIELTPDITIYCMPHLDKSNIQALGQFIGKDESQKEFNALIRAAFEWFIMDAKSRLGLKIYLGHHHVSGSKTSTGQELHDPGLTQGFVIPPAWLMELNCHVIAVGHIHMAQNIAGLDHIFHISNICCENYGEQEAKGIRLIKYNTETDKATIQFIENPENPKLITESWQWNQEDQEWIHGGGDDDIEDAEVRAEAHYNEGENPDIQDLIKTYTDLNVKAVKIKRVVTPKIITRASLVAKAESVSDKLTAYWDHIGAPSAEYQSGIMNKLAVLGAEV